MPHIAILTTDKLEEEMYWESLKYRIVPVRLFFVCVEESSEVKEQVRNFLMTQP